jgi:predicted GIY-YIG superfamily endonuclease
VARRDTRKAITVPPAGILFLHGGAPTARPKGFRVLCPQRPDWGLGHVLSDDGGARVTVFFLEAGRRTLDTSSVELELVTGKAAAHPILDVAAQANWQRAHHNLYVVELKAEVFSLEHKFREANPGYTPSVKPCVYVGMTGLEPEERLQEHRSGNHSARFVKKYGVRLLPELYRQFNPMPYALAIVMEVELARRLRDQGYGVWQN